MLCADLAMTLFLTEKRWILYQLIRYFLFVDFPVQTRAIQKTLMLDFPAISIVTSSVSFPKATRCLCSEYFNAKKPSILGSFEEVLLYCVMITVCMGAAQKALSSSLKCRSHSVKLERFQNRSLALCQVVLSCFSLSGGSTQAFAPIDNCQVWGLLSMFHGDA